MDQTESLIVKQLKEGQERAYKYLYDRHYQVLCYVAAQYVKDDFLAETIVGDVIFHLWEVRETLSITTSLRSYLMTSVRHRCMDILKSQQNKREVPVSAVGLQDFQEFSLFRQDDQDDGSCFAGDVQEPEAG